MAPLTVNCGLEQCKGCFALNDQRMLWGHWGPFSPLPSLAKHPKKAAGFLPLIRLGRERAATWFVRAGQAIGNGGLRVGFGSLWVFDEVWFSSLICLNFWFCSVSFLWVLRVVVVFFPFCFSIFSFDSCSLWFGCW